MRTVKRLIIIFVILFLSIIFDISQKSTECIVCTMAPEDFPYLVDIYYGKIYEVPLLTLEQWKSRSIQKNEHDASVPCIITKRGQGFISSVYLHEGYAEIMFDSEEISKYSPLRMSHDLCQKCIENIKLLSLQYGVFLVENASGKNNLFYSIAENTVFEMTKYTVLISQINENNKFYATLYIKNDF